MAPARTIHRGTRTSLGEDLGWRRRQYLFEAAGVEVEINHVLVVRRVAHADDASRFAAGLSSARIETPARSRGRARSIGILLKRRCAVTNGVRAKGETRKLIPHPS